MNDEQTVRKLVQVAIEEGYTLSIFDGEEMVLTGVSDVDEVVDAMMSTDTDTLSFHSGPEYIGSMYLVYGNGPGETISDHTANDAMTRLYGLVVDDTEH